MARRTVLSAAEKALRLLAVRPHSEAELRRKLFRSGFPPDEIDTVIADCLKRGYLNDQLLAGDSAQMLNQRGCGARLIRQKLRQRGIAPETAAAAAEANAANEEPAARMALEFKLRMLRGEKNPRKKKEKAFRFLLSRGFASGLALKLLQEMLSATMDEEEEFFDGN